jgi:hypothetical protein
MGKFFKQANADRRDGKKLLTGKGREFQIMSTFKQAFKNADKRTWDELEDALEKPSHLDKKFKNQLRKAKNKK